uniref:SWI/SNF complex subunit SWI3D n=1 Tax=Zea mays TaxID=4577 RepID=C0PDG1_MAIZE|nr:unknown [Zea mays]
MEPKPSPPPAAPSRRRGAATKRKEKAASAVPSGSPSPKRQARERGPVYQPSLPPPQPRSRQPARKPQRKPARNKSPRRSVEPPRAQEEEEGPPPLPPPRPSLEKEIEAVLSRGAGVHVVPTFAGWFSWKEIHPIEKQMLATFFDGKSERRTPEIYLGIRNLIMNKFHCNPEVHLESKDLCELSVGEMDARLVILEFLAYWGLVNFHPFPSVVQEHKLVESKSSAETAEGISQAEKLFQFETVHSYLVPVSKEAEAISPVQFTSLLPEPTLAEDAIGAAESSVEYHCNSCSVDCSRKRYHCRTQVDFDFCSDCYNEEKFDEGMSKSDFILMESADVPGSGGSNWTDHETLLLLEALEIFKGKEWHEIAEHVATKTKEQCMLHFLQMPISEPFLDGDDFNETPQKITKQDSAETGPSDVPDKMDVDGNAEGKESTDEKAYKKADSSSAETRTKLADQNISAKEDTMKLGDDDLVASIVDEPNKSSLVDPAHKKNSANADVSGEHPSNFITNILRSTFEAVDHFLGKEDMGSFAEAGNPVMALAAFLASLVERDDAVSSCCSSLRAISEMSPALQLATEHCFILPDPPSDLKDPASTFRR